MASEAAEQQITDLIQQVSELHEQAKNSEALELARGVCDLACGVLGRDHPATAIGFSWMGILLREMGDLAAARPYFEQALKILRHSLGDDHPHTATNLSHLGTLLLEIGDLAAARPYLEQDLERSCRVLGKDHPDTATSYNNLGMALKGMGELEAARPYLERALEICRQVMGEDHPNTAGSLSNLAGLLWEMGDLASARLYFEQAVELHSRVLGENHPDTASCLYGLGSLLQVMSDFSASIPYLERALEIRRRVLGEGHPDTAASLKKVCAVAFRQCIEAFLSGDYATCVEYAWASMQEGTMLHPMQLLLIGLQRLGQEAELQDLGSKFLAITADYPWEQSLLRLTLGQADPQEALEQATDTEQRCQVMFYIGARMATLGEVDQATHFLTGCAEQECNCLERRLAQHELAAVTGKQAEQFVRRIVALNEQGRFEEMRGLAQKALEVARQHHGEDSPLALLHLYNLAEAERKLGNPVAAEPCYLKALDLARSMEGEDSPIFARITDNLALLYKQTGRYAEAEPLYRQALEVFRVTYGKDDPNYAEVLNNLAMLYQAQGEYAAAEPLFRQALEICQVAHGVDHPDTLLGLDNLARLLYDRGDITACESLLRQALEIRRRLPGIPPKELADNLINLAAACSDLRDLLTAEQLEQEGVMVLRRTLGENHPYIVGTLRGIAKAHFEAGRYGLAGARWRQALAAQEAIGGENQEAFAEVLENLGAVFIATGNMAAAERHYRRAFEIRRVIVGDDHPDTVESRAGMARVLKETGRLDEAINLYRACLEVRQRVLEEDHPGVIALKNNLAMALASAGNSIEAEPLLREALAGWRAQHGENHPDYADGLINLARLCQSRGDYAGADALRREALAVQKTQLGEDHPRIATSLNNLADLCAATSRFSEAFTFQTQAQAVEDCAIGLLFAGSAETQQMVVAQRFHRSMHAFLSLVIQQFANDSARVGAALDLVLRRKALGAEAAAAQQETVLSGRYPELETSFSRLAEVREWLAKATLAGPEGKTLEEHRRHLEGLRDRRDALESELSCQIVEIRLERQLRAADRRTVAAALPEKSSLVEFVRFAFRDFQKSSWGPARYLAFVLPAGEPDGVRLIDLGKAEEIDRLIASFRALLTGESERWRCRDVVRIGAVEEVSPDVTAGTQLRVAIIDPILGALGGRHRLFLAPDGDLARIPFETLPLEDGRHLIDAYHFSYLVTGRDLLRIGGLPASQGSKPLVIADPDFDLNAERASSFPPAATSSRTSRDLKGADFHFDRLLGTVAEGEQIAALLGVKPFLGSEARESRLKACRSPAVLHLATHGFFLEDNVTELMKAGDHDEIFRWVLFDFMFGDLPISKDVRENLADIVYPETVGRFSLRELENPLLRSGLALAGANTWLHGGFLPTDAEDGLLTALDVGSLDLRGTELVVLSACETGLGEVCTGEGVFGLRRAFIVAGARTLVMSLWKVPDEQTRELMIDFYRRVLSGQGVADALRQAQLAMRQKHPDPYFWGAFICQGNPGPLALSGLDRQPAPSLEMPSVG